MLIHSALTENGVAGPLIEKGPGDIPPMLKKSPNVSVLIIDDEPLIRWSLAEILTDRGYGVLEAGDGRGAVEVLSEAPDPVDVIMLDYRLPDSNGLQVLARIRTLSPSSRVVLMTAYGTPEVFDEAMRLGAFCVVNKPIEMQDVASLVARARGSAPA
jgi:DNA-binding NtrC family response regulator